MSPAYIHFLTPDTCLSPCPSRRASPSPSEVLGASRTDEGRIVHLDRDSSHEPTICPSRAESDGTDGPRGRSWAGWGRRIGRRTTGVSRVAEVARDGVQVCRSEASSRSASVPKCCPGRGGADAGAGVYGAENDSNNAVYHRLWRSSYPLGQSMALSRPR